MTDPIGTAQERELIELLREEAAFATGVHVLNHELIEQAADALLSRIAEVERLTARVTVLTSALTEYRNAFQDGRYNRLFDADDKAQEILSQHRKL